MVNEEIRAIAERIRKNIAIMIFTSLNPLELCQNAYCSLIGLKRQRGADIIVGHESAFAERLVDKFWRRNYQDARFMAENFYFDD
ncbi:MAG: hypothetical protein IJL14_11615 [Selenomonadaceae bacterium]|nr:hypothetical protein [Selenomonadaceae bacterium]